jgi:hypothetical protein
MAKQVIREEQILRTSNNRTNRAADKTFQLIINQTKFFFTFTWPCIVTNFFIIKPTRCTNFKNLFWHESVHVSDSSSVHHQEFIHCTLSNGICHTAFRAGSGWNCSSIRILLESCLQTYMTYTIAECTVNKLLMMYRGTVRNM